MIISELSGWEKILQPPNYRPLRTPGMFMVHKGITSNIYIQDEVYNSVKKINRKHNTITKICQSKHSEGNGKGRKSHGESYAKDNHRSPSCHASEAIWLYACISSSQKRIRLPLLTYTIMKLQEKGRESGLLPLQPLAVICEETAA